MSEPAQVAHKFEQTISHRIELDYLLYVPKTKKKRLPLLLFLHGAGERGNNLELVKVLGPPRMIEAGHQFPFIVVSPQCPERQTWDVKALEALLDQIAAEHPVDLDRVYVTGLSMGGYGTWGMACANPDRYAAIAPICGGGSRLDVKFMLAQMPAWVFHGAQDTIVTLDESERLVQAMRQSGNRQVKFSVYKNVGHDSWVKAYANPKLYDWLLSHQRLR